MMKLPVLVVCPTAGCNSRCIACDYWKSGGGNRLSVDIVEGLLPDCREMDVENVVISGGEPLLHPDLSRICAAFHAAGIRVTLLTNGFQLGQQASAIATVVHELIVSLDGPETVHDYIRGGSGAFQHLRKSVEIFRRLAPEIPVTGRCTVQRANHRHLPETVAAAHQLSLDKISFLAVDTGSIAFARSRSLSRSRRKALLPDPDGITYLRMSIDGLSRKNAADFSEGFIVETPEKLHRILPDHFAAEIGGAPWPPVSCNAPLVSAVVESDGMVRACFFGPVIGNIHRDTLRGILTGSTAESIRRRFVTHRFDRCSACVCSLNFSGKSS